MLTQTIGAKDGVIGVVSSDRESIDQSASLTSTSRLRLDGIAGVTVGMTLDEASRAGGVTIEPPARNETINGCGSTEAVEGPKGLSFMVVRGEIVRIDVHRGPIRTLSGVGIGTEEDVVIETYRGQIEVDPHPYVRGHYLTYVPEDGSGLSLIFETDGFEVTSFRSGEQRAVSAIEGCA